MGRGFSGREIELYEQGPFPGRIDPWAEMGRYFQQIHSGMIDHFLSQTRSTLMEMGYITGREASLQIAEGREPDVFIQRAMDAPLPALRWNYDEAATEILAEPGVLIEADVSLQAVHIKSGDLGRLVTVVEIISPNNKTKPQLVADYRTRRERLLLDHGVNVVEIDPTRSVRRLLNDSFVNDFAYHVAVFIPGDSPRVIGTEYGQPLSRIALPLRGEVVPLETQAAYNHAYQLVTIAAQIHNNQHYSENHLPFPSLLTEVQQQEALAAVKAWREELAKLR